MKSTDIAIAAAVILAASGLTSCYDDSGLKERIENVEGRVQSIEERINAINTDIASLRQLIASLPAAQSLPQWRRHQTATDSH